VKLLFHYLNVCDHNPAMLQTDRQSHIAIPLYYARTRASRGKKPNKVHAGIFYNIRYKLPSEVGLAKDIL